MEVHPGHPLGGFRGVVVVVHINDQRLEQAPHLLGHLVFQGLKLPLAQMGGDIVVGKERDPRRPQALTNAGAGGGWRGVLVGRATDGGGDSLLNVGRHMKIRPQGRHGLQVVKSHHSKMIKALQQREAG